MSAAAYAATPASGSLIITVNRSGSSGAVTAQYSTANGTAIAGTDFSASSGTLSWANGDVSAKTFAIPILAKGSGGKTFSVVLSNVSGATLGTQSATITIAAATAPLSTIALSAPSYSVKSSASSLTVVVARSGGSSGAASIKYATANGTAVAGADYVSANGTLNWATGDASSKSFAIPLMTSGTVDKSFAVALSNVVGAKLGTPASATVAIAATPAATTSTGLKISVSGDHFIDGSGKTIQLRGANVSGLEFVSVQGWDAANPWG
ncbi:MAG TPA: Calx-beta domain-containing protein, partial [Steroidobacteraceae bacterium]|nr:Calx-beta domain-containing protein [Steroidobacteraceae bacterium]